jgi:hypothetical protein
VSDRFWVLRGPPDERALAEWDASVRLEALTCSVNPDHQRPGRRLGDLRVVMRRELRDTVWTWQGDCLLRSTLGSRLAAEGITGFTTRPATIVNSRSEVVSEDYSELVVTGWGGVAPPESGIRLETSCSVCGLLVYTSFTDVRHLIEATQWDGSDVFMVWPLPRFVFVSNRLADLLRRWEVTGLQICAAESLAARTGSLSPGRLSDWMPDAIARNIPGSGAIL